MNFMNQYLVCALTGVLGVIAHSLLKYNSLQNKAVAGNVKFTFKDYLQLDAAGISLSFVAVGIWLLMFSEVITHYPQLEGYKMASFAAAGFFGSYIIQYISSTAEKKITAIIDSKTTKSDGVAYPVTDIKDAPKS